MESQKSSSPSTDIDAEQKIIVVVDSENHAHIYNNDAVQLGVKDGFVSVVFDGRLIGMFFQPSAVHISYPDGPVNVKIQ